jgi:cobalamin biosynthesis protein CobD/CbiB
VINGTRRFFKENGDPEVQRIYGVAAACALVLLPLGALKGDLAGAVMIAFVLEVAIGVLFVLFCASNRQAANHRATKLMAARVESAAQQLGVPSPDSRGYSRLSCN